MYMSLMLREGWWFGIIWYGIKAGFLFIICKLQLCSPKFELRYHPACELWSQYTKLISLDRHQSCFQSCFLISILKNVDLFFLLWNYLFLMINHSSICDSYYRSYYRCSYKSDEECEAMKHVQRIQEDPPLYRTIYYGHHNCKSSLSNSDITLLEPNNTSSMFLSFNDSFQCKEQFPFSSSKKMEPIEMINPYDHHIGHNQLITSDYPLSCDYEDEFDYLRHATMLSSTQSLQFHDGCGRNLGTNIVDPMDFN